MAGASPVPRTPRQRLHTDEMPPLVLRTSLVWFLVLCVAAWTWGDPDSTDSGQVTIATIAVLALLGAISIVLGAVLVRARMGAWGLGAAALGSLVGTVLTTTNAMRAQPDSFYPEILFLSYLVFLGVGLGAGSCIGALWRRVESRH